MYRQPFLISYDITNDRLRGKLSDYLLQKGLVRLQYSVFLGPIKPSVELEVKTWIKNFSKKLKDPNDQVCILGLTIAQVEKMRIFGNRQTDTHFLAGTQHTMIL